MAKTRSQVLHPPIKKEENERKPKPETLLQGTKNTSKIKNKIAKPNTTTKSKATQLRIANLKQENTHDNKVISALPMTTLRAPMIAKEKIKSLIDYIVDDKMSVLAAAKKVRMCRTTAYTYYRIYKNDPEHKIPSPKERSRKHVSRITQKNIEDLIHYIVHDKLNITHAADKADISKSTAAKYYAKYLEDPDRKIPKLIIHRDLVSTRYTQEQIERFIGYIVNDNMSVTAASRKANMNAGCARRYYLKYKNDQNYKIPVNNSIGSRTITNEKLKTLIGCIVHGGMTLLEASVKANMGESTARKYYRRYMDDPNHKIPMRNSSHKRGPYQRTTLDQANSFFSYIIIDKLSITQASHKANVPVSIGYRYYKKYLKNPTEEHETIDNSYSVEKMKKMVEYIQSNKMNLATAAKKVNLSHSTAHTYFSQYLKNPQLEFPVLRQRQYKHEVINRLVGYIKDDKMSISSAAKKVKMAYSTALTYYGAYQEDQEDDTLGQRSNHRIYGKYARIVANIYKKNPSIKPIHESHHSDSDTLDVPIKQEEFKTKPLV